MFPRNISFGVLALLAIVAGGAVGALFTAANAHRRPAHDSTWRRTASGWERSADWGNLKGNGTTPIAASAQVRTSTSTFRLDTHPAALALAQLVSVLAAMAMYSRQHSARSAGLDSVKAAISRSFRASFFGC